MELFPGRVIADAKLNTLNDERQVVNFSIAVNNYYNTKNSEEGKKPVTYINCSYRISTKIAARITKGAVLEIMGRLYVTSFMSGNDARASLNCHVSHIKFIIPQLQILPSYPLNRQKQMLIFPFKSIAYSCGSINKGAVLL